MFQMMNPLSGIETTGRKLQIMIWDERNMLMLCVFELMYVFHVELFSQLFCYVTFRTNDQPTMGAESNVQCCLLPLGISEIRSIVSYHTNVMLRLK